MNPLRANAGQVIELMPIHRDLTRHETTTLLETDGFRLLQIRMPAGSRIPRYQAEGEIVLQCIEGQAAIFALDAPRLLEAGQLLHLATAEPFTIEAVKDSSLIASVIHPMSGLRTQLIGD